MAAGAAPQPTTEGRPPILSFRDTVLRPHIPIQEITELKNRGTYKGEPALFYDSDEVSKLAAPFDHVLVGKFSGVRPNMEFLRKGFQIIGFKGDVSLGLLDANHILIRFSQHDDYFRCWMRGSWSFKKHVMKVLKWTPDFTADHEPPVAPVWISFNHLPIHLFQKGPLTSLTSLLGRPLRIDAATRTLSRPSVARICVEVNLLRHLPHRVWIGHGDSGFWQQVTYDNLPTYCTACSRLGHSDGDCSTVVPPIPQAQVWKPKNKTLNSEYTHPHTSGLSLSEKAQIREDIHKPFPEDIPAPTKTTLLESHPSSERDQSHPIIPSVSSVLALVQPLLSHDAPTAHPIVSDVGPENSELPPVIVVPHMVNVPKNPQEEEVGDHSDDDGTAHHTTCSVPVALNNNLTATLDNHSGAESSKKLDNFSAAELRLLDDVQYFDPRTGTYNYSQLEDETLVDVPTTVEEEDNDCFQLVKPKRRGRPRKNKDRD